MIGKEKNTQWVMVVLIALMISGTAQANTAPEVTNVVATQRPGTYLVDITYDLYDADGDKATVTAYLSIDGGMTYPITCETVIGDVGEYIESGVSLDITWDAGVDYPEFSGNYCSIRIVAEEGIPNGFVLIPSGTFMMGSPETEVDRSVNEAHHQVTLTHDFWMQSTEVTNQQYAGLAQWAYDNGYCAATSTSLSDVLDGSTEELVDLDGDCQISFDGGLFSVDVGKESHPVMEVTWYGSVAYCDWLSLQQGLPRAYSHSTWLCNAHDPYHAVGYRLPTEAEWEYACRAGTLTPFNTGECLYEEANYNGNAPYADCAVAPYIAQSTPVSSFPANGFGLYDMHGNLYEWCNDWWGVYSGAEADPAGPSTGSVRVRRGGFWFTRGEFCRSATRLDFIPSTSYGYIDFRVVKSAN